MNSTDYILNKIKEATKKMIEEEVNQKINEQVEQFKRELLDRKDEYISKLMKGIRVFVEMNNPDMCPRFKIEFENIYRIER